MKLNQKRINSLFKQTYGNIPTVDFNGGDFIFPFDVKTGFVNATEDGITFNSTPENYSRFERIFTGKEAVSAIWTNSTNLYEAKENGKTILKKIFSPGESLIGKLDSTTNTLEFAPNVNNEDFTTERVLGSSNYYFNRRFSEEDLFKLYIIPRLSGKVIFYIESVEEFFEPGNKNILKYSLVKFKTLNEKLENTGVAIQQYVQFSSPGEGYAFPQLIPVITDREIIDFKSRNKYFDNVESVKSLPHDTDEEVIILKDFLAYGETMGVYNYEYEIFRPTGNVRGYILSEELLLNRPVSRAQLEIYGPGILSSVYAFGRPLKSENSHNSNLGIPRLLLPEKFNQPNLTQRDVTKPFAYTNSWYWMPRSRLEIESFYENWTKKIEGNWNPAITKKWLGYLKIISRDYNSPKPNLAWRIVSDIFSLGLKEISYNAPDVTTGDNGYWNIQGVQTLPKLLSQGYFTHRIAPRLPLYYRESIPWTFKNVPLVGGYLTNLTLGLPVGWKNQTDTGGRNYNVSGMISSGLLDFQKNTFIGTKTDILSEDVFGSKKEDYTAIPLDALSDEKQPSALAANDFATIINFDLTDRFYEKTIDSNKYWNGDPDGKIKPNEPIEDLKPVLSSLKETVNLGFIDKATNTKSTAWTSGSMPAPKDITIPGFAVDTIGFHFLGEADYKLTFFSVDSQGTETPVFNGKYKTLSKLTGSVRDWNNNLKLSHWEYDKTIDDRIFVPKSKIELPSDASLALNGIPNGYFKNNVLVDATTKQAIVDPRTGLPQYEVDERGIPVGKFVQSINDDSAYVLQQNTQPNQADGLITITSNVKVDVGTSWNNKVGLEAGTEEKTILFSGVLPTEQGLELYKAGKRKVRIVIKKGAITYVFNGPQKTNENGKDEITLRGTLTSEGEVRLDTEQDNNVGVKSSIKIHTFDPNTQKVVESTNIIWKSIVLDDNGLGLFKLEIIRRDPNFISALSRGDATAIRGVAIQLDGRFIETYNDWLAYKYSVGLAFPGSDYQNFSEVKQTLEFPVSYFSDK